MGSDFYEQWEANADCLPDNDLADQLMGFNDNMEVSSSQIS
jgi:hypothetical protein